MPARRLAQMGTVAASLAAVVSVVQAGDWPFRHKADPVQPNSLTQIARSIDDVEDKIRDKGIIVLKHPDVWSQSRMTKYRVEFDRIIQGDATKFAETLQAVINRSDQASLESETALAAVLTPTTRTNGRRTPITIDNTLIPTALTPPTLNAFSAVGFGMPATLRPPTTEDGQVTVDNGQPQSPTLTGFPTPFGSFANTAPAFRESLKVADPTDRKLPGIGLDPTVVLDEHKRYLDHLNQIRRVNMGDDIADSAGYGLYLIRMPISIQPGEGTYKGHGAQLTVTARHEFGVNFMSETFETLVINDIVDQIGPVIYDLIRTGQTHYREDLNEYLDNEANIGELRKAIAKAVSERQQLIEQIAQLEIEASEARAELSNVVETEKVRLRNDIGPRAAQFVKPNTELSDSVRADIASKAADRIISRIMNKENLQLGDQILDPVSNQVTIIDTNQVAIAQKTRKARIAEAKVLAEGKRLASLQQEFERKNQELRQREEQLKKAESIKALSNRPLQVPLLSSRVDNRTYPISPSDIHNVFLTENLFLLAEDVSKALVTTTPRAADVRAYLRHELRVAYEVMNGRRGGVSMLADPTFISDVLGLAEARQFTDEHADPAKAPFLPTPSNYKSLQSAYAWMIRTLPFRITLPEDMNGASPVPSRDRDSNLGPLGPLCWMIAVDAGYLNKELQADLVRQVNAPEGLAAADAETIHFYLPAVVPPELEGEKCRAEDAFKAYVTNRWKIITFAVDPTVEQQNIGDSFSRIRDLELAVAYSFAAGRINFQQLNRFRRQLQYEASTIGLNKTVTSFAYGNETFGWRFSPRYQNPPEERSNLAAFANLAYRGGPGRNYQIDNSKLEAGQRELTAVVIMPSFLQKVRFDVESRWWRLHDPDEVKPHTAHNLEIGRRVIELRQSLANACDAGCYRPEDLNRLQVKVDQLEQMLPLQTEHVTVPYGNALSGFDLFSPGATALAPELVGFQGLDTYQTGTDADIFLLGKNFSLETTKVTVGGCDVAPCTKEGETVPTFDILSREVIRVHVPSTSQLALLKGEGTNPLPYVEVFVATPNGISNPVRIPAGRPATEPAPADEPIATILPRAEARYTLVDDQLTVNGSLVKAGDTSTVDVRPFERERLRIIPLTPPVGEPEPIDATFLFPVKTSLNVEIKVPKIPFDSTARCYVIRGPKLDDFAADLFRKLRDNRIIVTDGSYNDTLRTRSIQVVIKNGENSTTSNQLSVNFRLYLEQAVPADPPATTSTTATTPAAASTKTTAPATPASSAVAARPQPPKATTVPPRSLAAAPPLVRGVPVAPRRDAAVQRTANPLPPLPPETLPRLPGAITPAARPAVTPAAKPAVPPVAKAAAPAAQVGAYRGKAPAPAPAAKTGLLPWSRKAK